MKLSRGLRFGEGLFVGAVLGVMLWAGAASAQERTPGRIPTVTRLVRSMLANEEQLATAVKGGDTAVLERLLAEDFEMRIGTAPGVPVPRDEWIKGAVARPGPGREFEQMSAHELGDIVIASFRERPAEGGTGTGGAAPAYVADVWKRSGDTWKLVRRFTAPANVAGFAPLGTGAQSPTLPKRP